jgi:GMP synthase PP-ATPase subunit
MTSLLIDFMTGVPADPTVDIDEKVLLQMVDDILRETPNISRVVYDLTRYRLIEKNFTFISI